MSENKMSQSKGGAHYHEILCFDYNVPRLDMVSG